jgi:hypothetical protein
MRSDGHVRARGANRAERAAEQEVTMSERVGSLALFLAVLAGASLGAQAHRPVVHMTVSLPDGQKVALSAPESGLAKTTTKDGTEYGFRPTIQDDKWTRVIVTIFRMATAKAPTEELGEVELKTGGPALDTKTKPAFKIAVVKVDPPERPKS